MKIKMYWRQKREHSDIIIDEKIIEGKLIWVRTDDNGDICFQIEGESGYIDYRCSEFQVIN